MHGPARYLAPCVAALLLGSTTGLAAGARGPAADLTAIRTAKRSALLELYAVESSLARARAALAESTRREHALAQARARALVRAAIVRRSLAATRERVARLLRQLYVEGHASEPVAVLFGARSLGAMLDGIDSLERATRRNRELAAEARRRGASLRRELARLARSRAALAASRRSSEGLTARLEAVARAKRSTLGSLRRREDLTLARAAALEAQARAAVRVSRRLGPAARRPSPTPASAPEPAPLESPASVAPDAADVTTEDTAPAAVVESTRAGASTLVVDAVAYHLPGRTASGLPVGVGVIAVDPSVIPLGTRVFVPGYGPAVAADVGSAIKGAIIDLWMPSTAAARAWGRRTVTITVYG
jgi:3D (Asp-Asp-Asp) domain-containing protein